MTRFGIINIDIYIALLVMHNKYKSLLHKYQHACQVQHKHYL